MKSEFSIGRKAFSLLELLVSITLLALVSALIYGAFFQVSNSSLKVKQSLSQSQELRLLMKMVPDDLQRDIEVEQIRDLGFPMLQA